MTHTRYGRQTQHTNGQLSHKRRSDCAPELDGALQKVARDKIWHYRQSGESIGHEDFYTARSVVSTIYSITAFHSFETSSSTFSSLPCSLSSMFCLSGTRWVISLELYLLLYSS